VLLHEGSRGESELEAAAGVGKLRVQGNVSEDGALDRPRLGVAVVDAVGHVAALTVAALGLACLRIAGVPHLLLAVNRGLAIQHPRRRQLQGQALTSATAVLARLTQVLAQAAGTQVLTKGRLRAMPCTMEATQCGKTAISHLEALGHLALDHLVLDHLVLDHLALGHRMCDRPSDRRLSMGRLLAHPSIVQGSRPALVTTAPLHTGRWALLRLPVLDMLMDRRPITVPLGFLGQGCTRRRAEALPVDRRQQWGQACPMQGRRGHLAIPTPLLQQLLRMGCQRWGHLGDQGTKRCPPRMGHPGRIIGVRRR